MSTASIALILFVPFLLATIAFAAWLVLLFRENWHRQQLERLQLEASIYTMPPDSNGNFPVVYLPDEKRFIQADSGNQGPSFPALTHYHHAPHKTITLHGRPLNVGSQDQRRLVIRSWGAKPAGLLENIDQETEELLPIPAEETQLEQILEADEVDTESPTREEIAAGLLKEGLTLRQVVAATGLTLYRVHQISKEDSTR